MFDPQPHLIQLPRKVKDKATGHWTTVYEDYLEVKWRLCWFRDRYPHGTIATEEICIDLERGYARYKATVADGEGGTATGYDTETQADFADFCERAETRALGRALAVLGFGTQFVGQDLTEGDHVADAPVRPPAATNGQPPEAGEIMCSGMPPAPEPTRLTADQARDLKKLAHTAFGFAEGERRLRHEPAHERLALVLRDVPGLPRAGGSPPAPTLSLVPEMDGEGVAARKRVFCGPEIG